MDANWEEICKVFVTGGAGAAALLLTPAALATAGFTAGGIAAGSLAAKAMALFAAANGGGVAAGGLIATLQSLGAAGLSGAGAVLTALTGGSAGWVLSAICNGTKTSTD